MKKLLLILTLLTCPIILFAQVPCSDANPFCSDQTYTFENSTTTTAPVGPDYGCLGDEPNPIWYYMEIGTAGTIDILIEQSTTPGGTPNLDVDFAVWGPYTDLTSGCADIMSGDAPPIQCSYSGAYTEDLGIGVQGGFLSGQSTPPAAQVGEVYIVLLTNFSGDPGFISFNQEGGTGSADCSIVDPCIIDNFTATISACNPVTNTYEITGDVTFSNPPETGQLIVEDCNGNQTVLAVAPFTAGTIPYLIPNLTPDGAACSVTTFFTDAPACSQVINYTAPAPCTPDCFMTNLDVLIGACEGGSVFDVTGTVQFTAPPPTGQLIVEDCNGNSQTFNPPFVSPTNFAINNINADGAACSITAYFTADPACDISLNYTNPASCNFDCAADIGTFTNTTDGTMTGNELVLCEGNTFTFSSNGDNTHPDEIIPGNGQTYDPGIGWLVYTCPPTIFPPGAIETDPCFLTYVAASGITDVNDMSFINSFPAGTFADNTIYFVPITFYDLGGGTYSYVSGGVDACFDMGDVMQVQYLPPITQTTASDCQAGTVSVTVNGGSPEINGTNFSASNLTPATASITTNNVPNGGTIVVSGLQDGDNYSFDITDEYGCPITITGTFVGVAPSDFTYPQTAYCADDANPTPTVTGTTGGTFSSTAGISINATTGEINLAASTPSTYTVTYTSPGAPCNSSTTFDVTINPLPVVDAPDDAICVGESVNVTATGADTYTWSPSTGLSATTGATVTANPTTTQTYTITGTITATGCDAIGDVTITVNPLPTADAGTDITVCEGAAINFSGNGAGAGGDYDWTGPTNFTNTQNPSIASATTGDAGTYTLTVTNSNGCIDQDDVNVVVNPLPVADAGADIAVCEGDAINFSGNGAGAGGDYDWTGPTNFPNTQNPSIASATTGDAGTYTLTVTDVNTCTDQDQVNVTVNPLPNFVVSSTSPTSCGGTDGTITLTGLTPGSTYDLTYNDGATPVGPTTVTADASGEIVITGLSAGSYSNFMLAAGTCSTTVAPTQVLVDPSAPTVNAGVDQTVCEGTNVTLTATNPDGAVISWDNGVTDGSPFTPAVGSTTYTVTANLAGCISTDQVDVIVNPNPVADAGTDIEVCLGDAINFSGNGAGAGGDYDWTGPTNFANTQNPSIASSAATDGGNYTLTVTDANACTDQDVVNVIINPLPTINAGNDDAICLGNSINITANGAGASGSYTWDNGLGAGASHSVSPTTTTTYEVTGTDANGCVNTDQVTITVNPNPTPVISGSTEYCLGSTATIQTTVPFTSYLWSNGQTTASINVTSADNPITVTVTDANGCTGTSADYTVTQNSTITTSSTVEICQGESILIHGISQTTAGVYSNTETSVTGCDSTSNITLVVNPLPIVDAPDATICVGDIANLNAIGADTYAWSPAIGLSATTGANVTSNVTTTQVYTITGTNTVTGCIGTGNVTVTVNPLPVINAGVDDAVCFGNSINITANGAGTGTYTWNNGLGSGQTHSITPSATATYEVTGTDANNCTNTDQVTITVNPLPIADAGSDIEVCENDAINFTGNGAGVGGSYNWSGPNAFTNTQNPSITSASTTDAGTYTLTVTDVNGCVDQDDVNVIVNTLPVIDAGLDDAICVDGTTNINASGAGASGSYTWDNGLGAGAAHSVSPSATTTYEVIGTDANGCQNTDQVTITVNPLPTVVASVDVAICIGSSTDISVSGAATYTWNNGLGAGQLHTVSPTSTTTYEVTGTDANGCQNIDQVTVTINPLPIIDAGLNDAICIGDNITLTANGAGASGSYTWDNGLGAGQSHNVNPTSTTTYEVTGTDVNGCENTDQVIITVNPLPVISAGADQTICDESTTMITANGAGSGSYTWDNGLGAGVSHNVAPNTTTTYEVTGTDANGCVNTDQVQIIVNPLPIVTQIPDQIYCNGESTTITNFVSSVVGTTYAWTSSNGTIGLSTSGNGSVPSFNATNTTNNPVTSTITVTPTANGCFGDPMTFTITVQPSPQATISENAEVCINGTSPIVTFTGSVGTTPYTITYNINGTGNQTITTTGNTATLNAPTDVAGLFVYNLVSVEESAHNCSSNIIGSVTITVHDLPTINAGIDQEVCVGFPVTLTATGAGLNGTYDWDQNIVNNVAFTPNQTLIYTVTGTDENGCVNTDQVEVVVNEPNGVDAGLDQVICLGDNVTLSANSTDLSSTYDWDHNVQDNVPFSPLTSTTYTVTATDVNGCISYDDVDVIVNDLPIIDAGSNVKGCEGDEFIFTGSGAGANGTYDWSNGIEDGVAFVPPAGINTFYVTGTDANGCSNIDSLQVAIQEFPTITFYAEQEQSCAPVTATFYNTTQYPDPFSCVWYFDDGTTFTGCGPVSHVFTSPGTYGATLQVTTDKAGCQSTLYQDEMIQVDNRPVAHFSTNPEVGTQLNNQITFLNESYGATNYYWEFGDGIGTSNAENPTYEYSEDPSIYTVMLVASTDAGCVDTAYRNVEIEEELVFYVPNTFTPDNDQFNQTFKPVFTYGYDPFDYTLLIFNRWGENIFESHNAAVGWDGTYNGKICQDGTYTWKIEVKVTRSDERKTFVGHVNLLK